MQKQKQESLIPDLHPLRHSAEHVLHQAMKELYPSIHLAMGPATDEGFYFDFDGKVDGKSEVVISEADFPKIEKRMAEIIKKDLPITRYEVSEKEARKLFADNPYKQEWIDKAVQEGKNISIYWTGEPEKPGSMVDLCKGPHVESTGKIKAFKLLSVAGAYWHGDEKNKMLTRIYGTAFFSQQELEEHLKRLEDAKLHDHRKLGRDLNLFVFSDLVGKGLPMLTPYGTTIRRELERFVVDEEIRRGYQHVMTPSLAKVDLYRTSGHYPYYKDTMYPPMVVDEDELILRPMTCPHHFQMYVSRPRSYRELPIRYAELADLFRYEKSGELSGLMRVRTFCLADAHIICTKEQAVGEINAVLDLIEFVNNTLGMKKGVDYRYRLSLGDRSDTKKYYKDDSSWDYAEGVLRSVVQSRDVPYYEAENEAAFYGPKIDVQVKNVAGKEETAFTCQYDFVMPKRFKLRFTNAEGAEEEPIVVHRSSIGAFERTMAFLIEKYAGAFPLWLSPVQVKLATVSEKELGAAEKVKTALSREGIRVELDDSNRTLGKKSSDARSEKVPYFAIVGAKEAENGTVTLKNRAGEQVVLTIDEAVAKLKQEIVSKQ